MPNQCMHMRLHAAKVGAPCAYQLPTKMPAVTFEGDRYSFCKIDQGDTNHWRHVIAKLHITIVATTQLQRILVTSAGVKLVNLDCALAYPALKCGRGYILAVDSPKSRFQLRLDPQSYAQAMRFLEKQKIPVTLVYNVRSRPNSMASMQESLFSDLGSSTGRTGRTMYPRIPSSKLLMGSPDISSLSTSPCLFGQRLPWIEENIIADTKLDGLVGRYGRCVVDTKSWKFVFRSSHLTCSVKNRNESLYLTVFLDGRILHRIDLGEAPILCGKSAIKFTDKRHVVQLEMGKEFLYGLVLEMQKMQLHYELIEA